MNSSRSGLNITESLQSVFAIAEADLFSPSTRASSPKKSPSTKVARGTISPLSFVLWITTSPSFII